MRNTSTQLQLSGSAFCVTLLQTVGFALDLRKLQGNCIEFLDVLSTLGAKHKKLGAQRTYLTQNVNV